MNLGLYLKKGVKNTFAPVVVKNDLSGILTPKTKNICRKFTGVAIGRLIVVIG